MEVDIRKHEPVRQAVHAGLAALRVQARQIWGKNYHQTLPEIALRLTVSIGDIARFARDPVSILHVDGSTCEGVECGVVMGDHRRDFTELEKELGNLIFSTIRWIDDLGLDPLRCLDLAIEAQEKFAKSGRPR